MPLWLGQRSRRDSEFVLPVVLTLRRVRGTCQGAVAGLSGQFPGPVVAGQPEREEAAEVERGGAVVQPGVVLVHAAVGHAPVAAGKPRDGAFDHRPMLAVHGLEVGMLSACPVLALELMVLAEADFAAGCGGGASGT